GGYELALACDWRIAADAPSVRVGLPETSLGLLPAAGGTQRLPRLVGLPRALDQILNARRSNARRALRAGLVDEVVHPAALERAAIEGRRRGEAPNDIAIVGAGLMGSGIAQSAAMGGATVRLRDVDTAAVARGLDAVRKLTTDAARKRVIERRESARVISRVTGATDYSGFRRADLVIEAVFEDIAVKRNVIKELEDAMREDAVIATNTSALPIAEIARNAMHPERIVGMHFFSPVHRMPLVEVVRPEKADPRALARVVAEAQAMGKTAIVVRDTPGFYTTRVLGFMLAEAMSMLEEGARIEDIDRAMVAFGWPIGPLALTDEVGLVV